MATKGKGSHCENRGSKGSSSRNGKNHSQSNPGRSSGARPGGGNC